MRHQAVLSLGLAIGLAAPITMAQSTDGPSELPPADFVGNDFVDSQGCAFVRVTVNGESSWVQRVDQDRVPLCDFEPTFAFLNAPDAPSEEEEMADVAEEPAQTEATEPETAEASDPDMTEDAATAETTAKEIENVEAPVQRPSPRRLATSTPRAAQAPTIAQASIGPISDEEACVGKSGIQPGTISTTTGAPLDCGIGPDVPRLTLAEICDRAAATGIRYINAETGEAVSCASEHRSAGSAADAADLALPYIQVGSFRVPSNAERLMARLRDLGLPVASGQSGSLRIVATGPFTSASAQQQALAQVRGLGFTDAFLRN